MSVGTVNFRRSTNYELRPPTSIKQETAEGNDSKYFTPQEEMQNSSTSFNQTCAGKSLFEDACVEGIDLEISKYLDFNEIFKLAGVNSEVYKSIRRMLNGKSYQEFFEKAAQEKELLEDIRKTGDLLFNAINDYPHMIDQELKNKLNLSKLGVGPYQMFSNILTTINLEETPLNLEQKSIHLSRKQKKFLWKIFSGDRGLSITSTIARVFRRSDNFHVIKAQILIGGRLIMLLLLTAVIYYYYISELWFVWVFFIGKMVAHAIEKIFKDMRDLHSQLDTEESLDYIKLMLNLKLNSNIKDFIKMVEENLTISDEDKETFENVSLRFVGFFSFMFMPNH